MARREKNVRNLHLNIEFSAVLLFDPDIRKTYGLSLYSPLTWMYCVHYMLDLNYDSQEHKR